MTRRPWTLLLPAMALPAMALIAIASDGLAAVLCKKPSGTVVLRGEACGKRETAVDLAALGVQGPLGPEGQPGQPGEAGPQGPSNGYVTRLSESVDLSEDSFRRVMELTIPTGSYVVTARLSGITLPDPDGPVTSQYRYRCMLRVGATTIDYDAVHVGLESGIATQLTYAGAGTYPFDTVITLWCNAANGHPLRAVSGVMTAVRVGALEDQPPQP